MKHDGVLGRERANFTLDMTLAVIGRSLCLAEISRRYIKPYP